MPTFIKVGGIWKEATQIQIKTGGVWKPITKAQLKVGGVWKTVWENAVMTVVLSPPTYFAQDSGFALSGPVSGELYGGSVVVTNGVAPYTYSWARVGDAAPVPFEGFNLSTVQPRWACSDVTGIYSETWRLTVTDSSTPQRTATADMSVQLSWVNLS